jgi:hypothetical protein
VAVITGGNVIGGVRSSAIGPYAFTGAPVNGTTGTLAGVAGPGAIAVQTDGAPPKAYVNTGTLASPTWSNLGLQT